MPRTLDERIVIGDVDEKSLAEVRRWPWGRDRLAALDRLEAEAPDLAPRLAGLRARLDHDAAFARAMQGRNAVLGFYLTSDRDGHRTGVLPEPLALALFDKYIGDALMAFWGAPLADPAHAAHAVRAAMARAQRLQALNAELRERGLPEIGVGMGQNTGTVCVGDMGSSMRRSYTVMGDAVNLSARIEALTRAYGVDLLVGQATRQAVDAAPAIAGEAPITWVEVDHVRVKGKQQGVTLFTPVGEAAAAAGTFVEEMRLWRLALDSYRRQHWPEALACLDGLRSTYPASMFIGVYSRIDKRIKHLRNSPPPAGWDGAHTFDSK